MNEENRKQLIALVALLLVLGGAIWFFVFKKDPEGPAIQARVTAAGQHTRTGNAEPGGGGRIEAGVQARTLAQQERTQNIKEVELKHRDANESRKPTAALAGEPMIFRARRIPGTEDELAENLLYEANRKNLTGIIWDDVTPMAVIDNAVVYVGYEFEEPIIVKTIERDYVVLAITGEDLEVVRQLKEQ